MTSAWKLKVLPDLLLVTTVFAAIVVADVSTGSDLTLRALYLVPVGLAAWRVGKRAALAVSFASVAISLYFDVTIGLTRLHPTFFYTDAVVRLSVYLGATLVLCALRDTQTKLRELSQTDPLTQLYNRRGFETLAKRELQRASRDHAGITIVHFDLDGFKVVNDAHGHAEGDKILVAVGETLATGRGTDIAARLGGDEFALLMLHDREGQVEPAAKRVVAKLDRCMRERGWPITFSVGAATFRAAPRTVAEMITIADRLMYDVKRSGKGGIKHAEIDGCGRGTSGETEHASRIAPTGRAS